MKPILYSRGETSFTNNGLGRLADCISCEVTEERNGIYECQFTYPVTGEMYSKIQTGCILGVIHDDAKDIQPFDIYAKSAPMNGVVTFYAHHISYRLGHVILKPVTYSSIAAAFADIPNKTYNSCPFTFWTDKSVSATWKVEVPSAVKAILGGVSGSILDVYGKGEYEWDKFTVKLHLNRGNDNGVSIRYGVNLSDLTQEYDVSGGYNAVAPYWKSDDGTLVTLTEGYIAASSVQTGEEIIPVPLDLSSAFENQPTEAQLRTEALRQLNNSEAWLPDENISVKFIDLAHTQEYKDIAALQRVKLCDKVSVYCGPLGVSAVKMQVIKTVYNVLLEEYTEIELGKAKTSFADTIMAKVSEALGDLPTKAIVISMLRQAIGDATDQITGAQNSHIRFIYDANENLQEIVILDTDSILTATKVWRWNSGGLGYSSNGYAGPYTTAITQNGSIVADFITSGTMQANRISGGVLTDLTGSNSWNLQTGAMSFSTLSWTAQNSSMSSAGVLTCNGAVISGEFSAEYIPVPAGQAAEIGQNSYKIALEDTGFNFYANNVLSGKIRENVWVGLDQSGSVVHDDGVVFEDVRGNGISLESTGSVLTLTGNNGSMAANGTITVNSTGQLTLKSSNNDVSIVSETGDVNVTASDDVSISSSGDTTVSSAGDINLTAQTNGINLNSASLYVYDSSTPDYGYGITGDYWAWTWGSDWYLNQPVYLRFVNGICVEAHY